MAKRGYVYVAIHRGDPGRVKIGQTGDLRRREDTLQGGARDRPIKIVDSVLVDDMDAVESAFHQILHYQADGHEWFKTTPDLVTPMLRCVGSRQPQVAKPKYDATRSGTKGGSWHEDGWKMHCEGASEAAIAKQFGVKPGTVASMKRKMRDAGRGHEERNRSRPERGRQKASVPGRIPQWAFRQPIVDVLRALGGGGPAKEVLRLLERKMDFSEADRKELKNGAIAWENRAQWERAQMKQDGVLKPDSERGWWELA